MKTSLKLGLIAAVAILFIGAFLFTFIYYKNKGTLQIEIYNRTSDVISDLKIGYQKNQKDILISGIPAKSYLKLVFKPQEEFSSTASGEKTMWLSYQDQNHQIHKEVIFGYLGKGYRGKALIKILKVEPDGVIKFEIKSDLKN